MHPTTIANPSANPSANQPTNQHDNEQGGPPADTSTAVPSRMFANPDLARDNRHPGGRNGQGLVLIAGFAGYTAMFTAAIAFSFVACSVAF